MHEAATATAPAPGAALAAGSPPPAVGPIVTALAKDWKAQPDNITSFAAKELSKRILQCETTHGIVASVHLEKVDVRSGLNAEVGRTVYRWLFDAHHIVMGDMNCTWGSMIGGAPVDYGRGVNAVPMEAWVKPETHAAAVRIGGTYLPGFREPQTDTWGKPRACTAPTFDMVVVNRCLTVKLLPKQLGPTKIPAAKLPRELMLPGKLMTDGWPSDHLPVIATVEAMRGSTALTVGTWNVADPWYFSKWWPDAGFGFEDKAEEPRLDIVQGHVGKLLDLCDVVGLQEVPMPLVDRLVQLGMSCCFEVQWVAAPSQLDEKWHDKVAGKQGRSSSDADLIATQSRQLPPVTHDMMFAKHKVLVAHLAVDVQ